MINRKVVDNSFVYTRVRLKGSFQTLGRSIFGKLTEKSRLIDPNLPKINERIEWNSHYFSYMEYRNH